eukprot:13757-Chlamydomonas_euryale.AAC.1
MDPTGRGTPRPLWDSWARPGPTWGLLRAPWNLRRSPAGVPWEAPWEPPYEPRRRPPGSPPGSPGSALDPRGSRLEAMY